MFTGIHPRPCEVFYGRGTLPILIVPLDDDTYYKIEEVVESEEWQQLTDEGELINGLTIVVAGELYEFPSEEEKEKKEA